MSLQQVLNKIISDDRSVSPVVATILMVAVVVVIAASIGAVTFGFTDELGGTETAVSDRCGVSEFDPENIDGFAQSENELYDTPCVTWFDAHTLNYDDGERVDRWEDRSASRFDALSVDGADDPIYRSSLDGVPAVEFEGNEGLATEKKASDANIAGETELSISAVVRPTGQSDEPFIQIGDPLNNEFRFAYNEVPDPERDWFISPGEGIATHEPNNAVDEWVLLTYVHDGDSVEVYVNGRTANIVEIGGNEVESFESELDIEDSSLQLGFDDGMVNMLNGAIAEMVFFDRALTDDERRSIECTMDDKYEGSVTIEGC